jgi:hypothetical protein
MSTRCLSMRYVHSKVSWTRKYTMLSSSSTISRILLYRTQQSRERVALTLSLRLLQNMRHTHLSTSSQRNLNGPGTIRRCLHHLLTPKSNIPKYNSLSTNSSHNNRNRYCPRINITSRSLLSRTRMPTLCMFQSMAQLISRIECILLPRADTSSPPRPSNLSKLHMSSPHSMLPSKTIGISLKIRQLITMRSRAWYNQVRTPSHSTSKPRRTVDRRACMASPLPTPVVCMHLKPPLIPPLLCCLYTQVDTVCRRHGPRSFNTNCLCLRRRGTSSHEHFILIYHFLAATLVAPCLASSLCTSPLLLFTRPLSLSLSHPSQKYLVIIYSRFLLSCQCYVILAFVLYASLRSVR